MSNKKLTMSFDPRTIEHLGIKMYSYLPNAIAELVANAYDACASEVIVYLYDTNNNEKVIIVEDNGDGMSFDEVNEKFLRIGRNRREEGDAISSCGRIATGKKGLGKLAFFGIGEVIEVVTCKNGERTTFVLRWNDLIHTPSGQDYHPESKVEQCSDEVRGTRIKLTNLKRKSAFDYEGLAENLAKLFNFSDNFTLLLVHNDSKVTLIDNKLKYKGIEPEFKWTFPNCIDGLLGPDNKYAFKSEISGEIITTAKPLKPGMRGITLFANGRMVNKPEFFGLSESSHFFSYATGWLDVNFIDDLEEDVISTNRQSLDWENAYTSELRAFLSTVVANVHQDWRKKRSEERRKKVQEKSNINIGSWVDTMPVDIRNKVETIIDRVGKAELLENDQVEALSALHDLVPEYPNLHWRHLHPEIRRVSEKYYQSQDYYTAFLEALKYYVREVRQRSGSTNSSDHSMMGEVFSGRKLSVTKKYKKSDGSDFSKDTRENIERGQQELSQGIVSGGRNPLSHEEYRELSRSGLFSEKDCLDFLSLLSHLFKRLEDAE